jgi:HlyD family secretion protein
MARRRATISAKITGKVIEVDVDEGMAVKEGQILARLDPAPYQVQLDLAGAQLASVRRNLVETETRLALAKLTLRRATDLVGKGVLSQDALDTAKTEEEALEARHLAEREQVTVAQRQLAVAQQALDETVIRAPFSGISISKDAQPGEIVSPISAGGGFTRTGICTIVDMHSLEVEVDVNESYIQRVKAEQKVSATLDAYSDWQIPAHVITIIPSADRQKATVKVRIGFDQLDPRILPDMGVKVSFLAAPGEKAQAKRTILVPRAAVRGAKGEEYVLVVANDRVEHRAILLGSSVGDPAEIVSGLSAGEQVIVEGAADLKDKDRVRVKQGKD